MIGRILGNRYGIVEKIGSGGMSHVYKARCSLLNRYVAVKILRPEYTSDENFVAKFKRESQAAASLSHQNIVSIYDVGVDDDIHYIVMEYIEGKTLKQLIREKKRLNPLEAAEIAQQICKALVHAHKNHIIHRDIKPHNILVTRDGTAKVTDFGIARAVTGATMTNSGSVIGSVHYFSPEQARGGYIDEKSDLYSLGIVMYEMVTGQVPFEGESPISIALKHLQEPVIPPGQLNGDLPKGLEQIIIRSTQKEPGKRYNTAEELLSDLKRFIKDKEIIFEETGLEAEESPTIVIPAIRENDIGMENNNEVKDGVSTNKNRRKRLPIFIALIALAAFIGIGFAASYLLKGLLYVKVVEVPNIVGETEEKARDILEGFNLEMKVRESRHNAHFAAGTIISQYPNGGTQNKITNPVLVILSLGPERTEVPYLINKNSSEAILELQMAGLVEGDVKPQYSTTVTVGVVIDQSPQPGIKVDQGTSVDLVISAGPQPKETTVPSVVGLRLETAIAMLRDRGIVVVDTFYQESSKVAEGYVISQNIPPDSKVEEGTSIGLVISSGSKAVQSVEGTKMLTIDLPKGEKDIKVTVKKYQDGVEEVEYQRRHDAEEGPLKVEVKGTGKVRVVVLFNDVPYSDEVYDFGKGD